MRAVPIGPVSVTVSVSTPESVTTGEAAVCPQAANHITTNRAHSNAVLVAASSCLPIVDRRAEGQGDEAPKTIIIDHVGGADVEHQREAGLRDGAEFHPQTHRQG